MTPPDFFALSPQAFSAIAALGSLATAVAALVIAILQRRTASQTADFSTTLSVTSALADGQRRLFAETDPVRRSFEFNNLLNLMETLAGLHNGQKLTPTAQKIIEEFLDETFGFLQAAPATRDQLRDAMSSPASFRELRTFANRQNSQVTVHTERFMQQQNNAVQPIAANSGI